VPPLRKLACSAADSNRTLTTNAGSMTCYSHIGEPNRAVQSASFTNRDRSIRQRSFAQTHYGPLMTLPRMKLMSHMRDAPPSKTPSYPQRNDIDHRHFAIANRELTR
jgi:hypothetical protein